MLARLLTTNSAIKQEPLSPKNCSSVLEDVRQAMESNKTLTINATVTTRIPYSQMIPASTTLEDGAQLRSVGTVHQHPQYYSWQKETIRNGMNIMTSIPVTNHRESMGMKYSGTERHHHRALPVENIKREKIGFPTHYTNCPVDTKFISAVQSRKAMALSLDSYIQLGGSPLSPGLAVPDNSRGLLSDMYTDYYGSGPLFEDLTSSPCKDDTGDLSFLMGCEDDLSLAQIPSGLSLEEEWLTEPTSLPLTPEEQNFSFTSVSPSQTPISTDWFTQPPTSLPLTPEKQEGDVSFTSVSPIPCTTDTAAATNIVYPTLTPESSLPGSPLSAQYYSEEEELSDLFAIFQDSSSPSEPIVIPSNPNSPTSYSSNPSPLSSTDSVESIRDLLIRSESPSPQSQPSPLQTCARTSTGLTKSSRKRKSDNDDPSYEPVVSRPTTSKRRLPQSVKKEKKREQNKNAALRYRQRKKGEKLDVEVRRQELEEKNEKLKTTVQSLENEINYLKKLWGEIVSAKKRKQQS